MEIINNCKEVLVIIIDGLQSWGVLFYLQVTAQSSLHVLICLIFTKTHCHYYPNFTNEGNKARRSQGIAQGQTACEGWAWTQAQEACLQMYHATQLRSLLFLELIKSYFLNNICGREKWALYLPRVLSDCSRLYSVKGSQVRKAELFLIGCPWFYPYVLHPRLIASVACLLAPQSPACGICLGLTFSYWSFLVMHKSSFLR